MDRIPTWVWVVGAVALVVVIALAGRSGTANAPTSVSAVTDPNQSATDQAAIAARAGGFGALVSGVFGLAGQEVTGATSTNIAAISGNTAGVQATINGDTARALADYSYQATLAQEAALTTRAGIAAQSAFDINNVNNQTAVTLGGINAGTTVTTTQINADAAAQIAAQQVAALADTNRTALAIQNSNNTVARQAQNNQNTKNIGDWILAALPILTGLFA